MVVCGGQKGEGQDRRARNCKLCVDHQRVGMLMPTIIFVMWNITLREILLKWESSLFCLAVFLTPVGISFTIHWNKLNH